MAIIEEERKINYRRIILLGVGLIVIGIVWFISSRGREQNTVVSTDDKSVINTLREGGRRLFIGNKSLLTIKATPPADRVFLDNKVLEETEIKVSSGTHVLVLEKQDYFTEEITFEVTEKEEKTIEVSLKAEPSLLGTYENRVLTNPQAFILTGKQNPTLVYLNSRNRLLEVNDDKQISTLLVEEVNEVNELWWNDTGTIAVAVTGGAAAEKKDYLVDFRDWRPGKDPSFTPLPFFGSRYSWSADGNNLLFLGDIDYGTGLSNLLTYNLSSGEVKRLLGIKISGVDSLYWINDSLIYGVEEVEVGGSGSVTLFKLTQVVSGSWRKEAVVNNLASRPILSNDRNSLIYLSSGNLILFDIKTGNKKDITEISKYNSNFGFTLSSDSQSVYLVYPDQNGRLVIMEFDDEMQNRYIRLNVSLREQIMLVDLNPTGDLLISGSSGKTYLLNL